MRNFIFIILVSFCFASCFTPPKTVLIADLDPLQTGTAKVGISKIFPIRVDQVSVPLMFDPRDNTVYLQFSYQLVTYRQFWDEAGRRRFIAAVEQYKKDFEAQRLTSRGSRARRAYGVISQAKTEWGHVKFLVSSVAYPRIEMGYTFYKKSPYFLVTQRSAKNMAPAASSSPNNSLQIELYFTRAMAEELAAAFDQEALLSYLPGAAQYTPPSGETAVTPDAYNPPLDNE